MNTNRGRADENDVKDIDVARGNSSHLFAINPPGLTFQASPFSHPFGEHAVTVRQDKDGSIYVGQVLNSDRHGQGSAFWPNGNFLSGTFYHGVFKEGFQLENNRLSFESAKQCISIADEHHSAFMKSREDEFHSFLRKSQKAMIRLGVSGMYNVIWMLLQSKREWKCTDSPIFSLAYLYHPISFCHSRFFTPITRSRAYPKEFLSPDSHHLVEQRRGLICSLAVESSSVECRYCANSKMILGNKPLNECTTENIRDEVAHKASPEVVFAFACPVTTELFKWSMFMKALLAFLFPFLALPGFFCAPCGVDASEIEREFIVSGASLLRNFNSPYLSLYVAGGAFLFEIAAIVLAVCTNMSINSSMDDNSISFIEFSFPIVLWILNALVGGSYFGFRQIPHGLEHMNRELSAELTALAANVIDSKSKLCIYTWDEAGREKEKNKWFRIKWVCTSLLVAATQSLLTIALRKILGYSIQKNTWELQLFAVLSYFSSFCSLLDMTYYTLKALDMQREELSKLHVLSTIAYLEGKSLLKAGTYTREYFSCDTKVDVTDLKNGFIGWYTTRSLVLCASPSANILSRGAAFSVLIFGIFLESVGGITFFFYKSNSPGPTEGAFFFIVSCSLLYIFGPICIHYLVTCSSIRNELQRHLYIMDVASLYHKLQNRDVEGSNIIKKCRRIAKSHDISPKVFNFSLNSVVTWVVIFCILIAMYLSVASLVPI